ncbi:MAG TPA: hypothetical protein DHV55_00730 [Clostridiaceae bacterium]|nr:hypothetical protein [Clostridiaceae bacterium]
MDSNRRHVQRWLKENFHLEHFKIQEMPIVPGGVIIKDKDDETMLVYWDILEQRIRHEFKN